MSDIGMIQVLKSGEQNIIKEFYQNIFDDSEAFVNYYFGTYIKTSTQCFIDEEQGIPVSMASVHEKKWRMKDGRLETVWYIYAVATLPKYRRQGRMTQVLNVIRQNAMQENIRFLYLIPVNPDIYKPFGFVEVMNFETVRWEYEAEKPMAEEKTITEGYRLLSLTEMRKQQEDIFETLANLHKMYYSRCPVDAYLEKTSDYYQEEYQRVRIEDGDIYLLLKGKELKAFIVGTIKDRGVHIVEYVDADGIPCRNVNNSYLSVMLELFHEQSGVIRMEYMQHPVMIYSVDGTPVPRQVGQMDEV